MNPYPIDNLKSFKFINKEYSRFVYYSLFERFILRYSNETKRCKWYKCPKDYNFSTFKKDISGLDGSNLNYITQYITTTTFEKVLQEVSEDIKTELLFNLNLFS